MNDPLDDALLGLPLDELLLKLRRLTATARKKLRDAALGRIFGHFYLVEFGHTGGARAMARDLRAIATRQPSDVGDTLRDGLRQVLIINGARPLGSSRIFDIVRPVVSARAAAPGEMHLPISYRLAS
jgi:hypothetical protein